MNWTIRTFIPYPTRATRHPKHESSSPPSPVMRAPSPARLSVSVGALRGSSLSPFDFSLLGRRRDGTIPGEIFIGSFMDNRDAEARASFRGPPNYELRAGG